jgi:HSP90 family molecular chaperone
MLTVKDYVNKFRVDIEESSRTRLGKDSVNMLNTVSESIFSRSAHFILELLQNAEDAKPDSGSAEGEIEFVISPHRIRVTLI